MSKKPTPRLALCARAPLFAVGQAVNGGAIVVKSRTVTSHLTNNRQKLDVTWRLYTVEVNNAFGAFGKSTRFMIEGDTDSSELRRAA